MGKTDQEKSQGRQTKLVYVAPSAVRLDDLHIGTGDCSSSGSGFNAGACGTGTISLGPCATGSSAVGQCAIGDSPLS